MLWGCTLLIGLFNINHLDHPELILMQMGFSAIVVSAIVLTGKIRLWLLDYGILLALILRIVFTYMLF